MRIFALFLLLLTCPASAFGAERNFGPAMFSAFLPPGWTAEPMTAEMVECTSPDGSSQVTVSTTEISLTDGPLYARTSLGGGTMLRALPEGQGFVSLQDGCHNWMNITEKATEGWAVHIAVSAPHKDVPALLRGLRGKNPQLQKLFATLHGSPPAMHWLAHGNAPVPGRDLPPLAGAPLPDLALFGAMAGERGRPPVTTDRFPEGWTLSTRGLWTVVSKGPHWCAARYYDLPAPEGDFSVSGGHPVYKVAQLVGGRNIIFAEGQPDFATPLAFASLRCDEGRPCLFTIFSDAATVYDIYISVD